MKNIFSLPRTGGALAARFLILALMAAEFGGCPTTAEDPGDTTAPGPVSKVYGWYNKMAGGVTVTWTDPADKDLAEIRLNWNGGSAAAAKGAGTYTVTFVEDRIGPSCEITLKAADAAGNEAEPVTVRVRPDITRSLIPVPGGTVTAPPPGTSATEVFVKSTPAAPVTVEPFYILATEVTYDLWHEVRAWAVSTERGEGRYTFIHEGREGNDGLDGAAPTANRWEPVTNISMRDAIVWCNAWSEKTGKTPAYYEDEAYTVVLRESQAFPPLSGEGKAETARIKPGADGYRLPAGEEWVFAARGGAPCDDPDDTEDPWNYPYAGSKTPDAVTWYNGNAGGGTHNAAEKQPNALGVYDMSGNVWEMTSYSTGLSSTTHGLYYKAFGGSYGKMAYDLTTSRSFLAADNYNYDAIDIGFRPVIHGGTL